MQKLKSIRDVCFLFGLSLFSCTFPVLAQMGPQGGSPVFVKGTFNVAPSRNVPVGAGITMSYTPSPQLQGYSQPYKLDVLDSTGRAVKGDYGPVIMVSPDPAHGPYRVRVSDFYGTVIETSEEFNLVWQKPDHILVAPGDTTIIVNGPSGGFIDAIFPIFDSNNRGIGPTSRWKVKGKIFWDYAANLAPADKGTVSFDTTDKDYIAGYAMRIDGGFPITAGAMAKLEAVGSVNFRINYQLYYQFEGQMLPVFATAAEELAAQKTVMITLFKNAMGGYEVTSAWIAQ